MKKIITDKGVDKNIPYSCSSCEVCNLKCPKDILQESKEKLKEFCEEIIFFDSQPESAEEIVERIGDADAVFVSYTHAIGEEILAKCPNLVYIGMCCSLYSEESSNVDIAYAREHGITVTGIRDYGDEGVAEYVLMNLIGRLHGTDGHPPLLGESSEISGARIGLLGLGASGQAVARALGAMGAQISYYSRTRKPELEEQEGYRYCELSELLKESDVVCSCLSKNVMRLAVYGRGLRVQLLLHRLRSLHALHREGLDPDGPHSGPQVRGRRSDPHHPQHRLSQGLRK